MQINRVIIAGIAALLYGSSICQASESLSVNHENVKWHKLKYYASAFFMSAETVVSYQAVNKGLLEFEDSDFLKPSSESMLRIDSNTEGFGKNTLYQLWIDGSGAALQRRKIVKDKEIKVYRFSNCGYHSYRKKFKNKNFDPNFDNWSGVKSKFKGFPESVCESTVVSEVNALLYLISALGFSKVGDEYKLLAVSDGRLENVIIKAVAKTKIHADYRLKDSTGKKTNIDRKIEVLKLKIFPEGGSKKFKFLGLRGNIYIYLEPEKNLIMRISGNVKVIGRLDINLKRAYFKSAAGVTAE